MLKDERKAELLQMIEESGYISVEELSSKLYISQSTIRRNLTQLEKLGYVKRTHGGVEMCDESYHAPVRLRMKKNHMAKSNVAKLAAERIRDDSIIFLDCSSTCLHMVPYLQKKKNITVYTNGVEMCSLLAETEIPVYCLGGCLIPKSRAFSGEMSIAMAKTMFFDAMFFSCAGWDQGIATDYMQSETCLRRVLLEQSREKYLLCDSSKFGKSYPYIVCKEEDLTEVITNADV